MKWMMPELEVYSQPRPLPKAALLTAALVSGGLFAFFSLLPQANGAVLPAAEAPPSAEATLDPVAANADGDILQVSFQGRFELGRAFKLRVGRKSDSPNARLVAIIETRKGIPVAECRMTHFERTRILEPTALAFECQNSTLAALNRTMTLLWKGNRVQVQFGNWIEGYETARVDVDRDLLNVPRAPLAQR